MMAAVAGAFTPAKAAAAATVGGASTLVAGVVEADYTVKDNYGDMDVSERVIAVTQRFARHDPDWLDTLERMANKLDQSPEMLTFIKSFI